MMMISFKKLLSGCNLVKWKNKSFLCTVSSIPVENYETAWESAKPFNEIPKISKLSFLMLFLPGGKLYNKDALEFHKVIFNEYEDLVFMPGLFGRKPFLMTFNPKNIERIFRTEGTWPYRRGLETMIYYREKIRPEFYKGQLGLPSSQGESWAHMRKTVNPVMLQPRVVKDYIPVVDEIANDFLKRINKIRNPKTMNMPENFEDELKNFALETVSAVALDSRLNLFEDKNLEAEKIKASIRNLFQLLYELEMKPSFWKIIKTPKFNKIVKEFDFIRELSYKYILEAKKRFEENSATASSGTEISVLEKLLQKDEHIAVMMAMDMIFAGVDTTSVALTSCLYNLAKNQNKQDILRNELLTKLPEKDSKLTSKEMLQMPYLRACIKESLRLIPVVAGNARGAGENIVLSGYQVPKGTDIIIPSAFIQTNDLYFPESKKFIPERWLREDENENSSSTIKTFNRFIFLPFGFGPRMCVGKRFAELEIELLISRILRNFHVEWNQPELNFKLGMVNVPQGALKFTFKDV